MSKRFMMAAALATGPLLAAGAAYADTISIGLQEAGVNGGAIQTVATGSSGNASFSGNYGTFSINNVSGTGNPPLTNPAVEISNSLNVSSNGGTLNVYVSETGIVSPAPTGLQDFLSAFTTNTLTTGWTVTETTYLDPGNGLYVTTTQLGTVTFPPLPQTQPVMQTLLADAGSGPYSVTAVYTITSNGNGKANSTINISTVPEPASLSLFGTALLGLGLFGLRRKRV